MTTPDPIEAAIAAGIDAYIQAAGDLCNVSTVATYMTPGMQELVATTIRAAAPILIAAGREEAARAIEADGERDSDCSCCRMDWVAQAYATIARGGDA